MRLTRTLLALPVWLGACDHDAPPSAPAKVRERIHLAETLMTQRRFVQAADELRKAIELDGQSPQAHYDLGLTLLQMGDFEGASAELQAALSLAPADVEWRTAAENALVEAHLRQRDRERNAPR
jgi:Flp pilus assembly protein TadD